MKSLPTSQPYDLICGMEEPLTIIGDLVDAMAFIAETIDGDCSSAVQRLAWLAKDQRDAAEKLRGDLFRLTHPRREHFEREGWPS